MIRQIIREHRGWRLVQELVRDAESGNNMVDDTLFSAEQFNAALRKVDIAKGKRLNRLRDQAQKTLTDKDDMKKLLGIDKWCQNRMKALTNEAAKLMLDGKKVMGTYKPCSIIISLTLTAVFGPSLHLALICRMRRSGLCRRR